MTVLTHARQVARPLIAAYNAMSDHGGFELAGHLSFTIILSIFPFLIFLAAVFGIFGDADTVQTIVAFLFEFAPDQVAVTLADPLYEMMRSRRGDLLTVGILGALWAASSGFEALRSVFNRAYGTPSHKSFLRRRAESAALVIILAAVLLVASTAIVLGPLVWDLLERVFRFELGSELVWDLARYGAAAILLFAFLIVMHRVLPDSPMSWHRLMPGVTFTLVAWLIISTGLSLYLASLGDYEATYGTLGGVVVSLLYFYGSALAVIYGAELNNALRPPAKLPIPSTDGHEAGIAAGGGRIGADRVLGH